LARVVEFGGAAVGSGGMEAREERPSLFRPAGVGERVVAAFLLVRKLRIAKLNRPLLDVEAELGEVEWQLLEAAEKPDERDPVIGWERPRDELGVETQGAQDLR
jgi:hypothetical protein